jgi:arylsulfatase
MDGVSLMPVLAGKTLDLNRSLFFSHAQGRGVRKGQWKASKLGGRGWELFNLDVDPGETRDVAALKPDEVARLKTELWAWMLADPRMEQKDGFLVPRVTGTPP